MLISAGIIVVRREADEWYYLLLRAFRNWDFPKGEVQAGEAPLDAALRETKEETGIGDLQFRWGQGFKETEPYNRGRKVARYYLASTSRREVVFSVNPAIGVPEHHEYRWLSYSQLEKLAPPRLRLVIRWARRVVEA